MKINLSFLDEVANAQSDFSEQTEQMDGALKNVIFLFGEHGKGKSDGRQEQKMSEAAITSIEKMEAFEERAGILEFEAGLSREEAERRARHGLSLFGVE